MAPGRRPIARSLWRCPALRSSPNPCDDRYPDALCEAWEKHTARVSFIVFLVGLLNFACAILLNTVLARPKFCEFSGSPRKTSWKQYCLQPGFSERMPSDSPGDLLPVQLKICVLKPKVYEKRVKTRVASFLKCACACRNMSKFSNGSLIDSDWQLVSGCAD